MTPRLFIMPPLAHLAMNVVVALVVLWRGDWRARLVGGLLLFQYGFNFVVRIPWTADHTLQGAKSLTLDILLLAACLACVYRARRFWVIWAAALALLEVVTDAVFLISPSVTSLAFVSADLIWSWALGATLIWGSLTSVRDRAEAPA